MRGKKKRKKKEKEKNKPCRTERNGMKLVCCKTIPNKEFTILRSTNKVMRIMCPLHCINFRKMSLKCTSDLKLVILSDVRNITCTFFNCLHLTKQKIKKTKSEKKLLKRDYKKKKNYSVKKKTYGLYPSYFLCLHEFLL